jgi:hypothetical protein
MAETDSPWVPSVRLCMFNSMATVTPLAYRSARIALGAIVGLLSIVALAGAQKPTPPSAPRGYGSIVGAVVDSIRRRMLPDATVRVAGTTRSAVSDAQGRFHIDSIPAGEFTLVIEHPMLDSLGYGGISMPTAVVNAGEQAQLLVSTPTYEALHDKRCSRGGLVAGPAMVVGRLLDAESGAPLGGGTVALVYRDNGENGVVTRVRQGRVNENGIFAICGLPVPLAGTLQATRGGESTAEMTIEYASDLLATALFTLGTSGTTRAIVNGKVINRRGDPIAGVQVMVEGGQATATTGEDGKFTLTGLPSGTRKLVARKIGLAAVSMGVNLSSLAPLQITLVADGAQLVQAVHVVGVLEDGLQKAGFTDRVKANRGKFLTPERITELSPIVFTDLLTSMTGMKVRSSSRGAVVTATRSGSVNANGCITVFIDNSRFHGNEPGDLDKALAAQDVGAVEFYASESEAPPQFTAPGARCASLVVWTKTMLLNRR